MLVSLEIENIAVIEKAGIPFDSGFNVLTGETGAGKSIVIDSLNAVLGERVSRDLIRFDSEAAVVTAVFSEVSSGVQKQLEERGYPVDEEGMLLIQRRISADGKGVARINGQVITVSLLREIGRMLVNIHGQHENQALLSAERHVDYLDGLGKLQPMREAYQQAYQTACSIHSDLEKADMDEAMKARRLDMLRFQIDEIESAEIKVGEEETLLSQRTLYRNAGKIADSFLRAKALLSGDEETDGALTGLSQASAALDEAGRYMEDAVELARRVESALYELEECAGDLREFTSRLDFDPAELDRTENRLEQIRRLESKYGATEEDVLRFLEEARRELETIETSDLVVARLKKELEVAEKEMVSRARDLTEARREASRVFTTQVMEQLQFLDMPGVRLEVSIEPAPLSSTGADKIEFLIAANPGEPAKSIAKIASGGELSRIMLAIKSVLAEVDEIDTLVFDEIDSGISGRAAWKVGVKLRQTAAHRQILCVTHLAQIAAQGHRHLLISKSVRDGRTFTDVTPLSLKAREEELARIIGGEATPVAMEAAREMLDKVDQG